MARISLLFTLTFVLTITTISAHPPSHKKPQKTLCPPTLSELQSFPYKEISNFIVKKVECAPKTIQFDTLFAICKSYNAFLGGFKVEFAKNVLESFQMKHALMANAMVDAEAYVGVVGELAVQLKKSFTAMAIAYGAVLEKSAEISAKYKFDANAKICKRDRIKIDHCLIKLKSSISVFVKVVTQCSNKFSIEKTAGLHHGLGGFIGAAVNHGLGLGGHLIGLGGHGQVNAGVKVGGHAGGNVGAKFGVHAGGKFGAKGGAHAGGKFGAKGGAHAGGKFGAKGGAHAGGKFGAKGGVQAGGNIGGFLGFGGKAKFDAAGKAKIHGGGGFRSLNHSSKKHLD